MASPLPDPQWSDAAALCPACGYSLAGLIPPLPCPECGLNYSGRQFVVHGVPSARSVMSRKRIALIVVLCIISIFLPQVLMMTLLMVSWQIALGIFAFVVLIVIVLVVTAPRSQGGRARFVFVDGGVNVTPLKIDDTKRQDPRAGFIKFTGTERVQLKPVSTVWARLTITRTDGNPAFEAGIRCPRPQADHLLTTIDELIRGKPAAPGTAPPTS